ncbi:MAG: Holliday junction resolvase RecU [Alkalibacterium sp.]|nr:Holliday junction resolvase RecU [Alkalibacterium sp.]
MQKANNYRGLKAKRNGDRFEHLLDVTCAHYQLRGVAYIQKTPEPMRVIAPISRTKGQYKAIFTKKAQPDYTGTLKNGQSIVFEAKNTDSTNIAFDRLSPAQEKDLAYHDHLGAISLIIISFNMKRFYAVPWKEWKKRKDSDKKKSVNEQDLVDFTLSTEKGLVDFLEGVNR